MSLKKYLLANKLLHHRTNAREIHALIELIERDIADAHVAGLSSDRRFATAYNAILQSAVMVLMSKGYRTKGAGHHYVTFKVASEIMGDAHDDLFDYFDGCRTKRNITDYSYAGTISKKEADEIVKEAEQFFVLCKEWVKHNDPSLVGSK